MAKTRTRVGQIDGARDRGRIKLSENMDGPGKMEGRGAREKSLRREREIPKGQMAN